MITRRRGRAINNTTMQCQEAEVVDAVEALDRHHPSQCSPADNNGATTLDELNDLFGIEDLEWTLDRDSSSPLFNMEFTDFEEYDTKRQNPVQEASTVTPSERTAAVSKVAIRPNQSSHLMNKNAVAARLNRLKKKEYVSSLENKVGSLVTENGALKQENTLLTKRVEELEDETRYLRAVLANESMLAQLFSRLSGVNGMKLSSSLFQGPSSNDHDYALPRKRVKVEEKETSGGVCLHVDNNHVSVEFCTKCAEKASTSLQM